MNEQESNEVMEMIVSTATDDELNTSIKACEFLLMSKLTIEDIKALLPALRKELAIRTGVK